MKNNKILIILAVVGVAISAYQQNWPAMFWAASTLFISLRLSKDE
jgi:hypothetical protein